jgi:membrane-bound lytic murein transglycosylase B
MPGFGPGRGILMAGTLIVAVAAALTGAATLAGRGGGSDSPLGQADAGAPGGASLVAPAAEQVGADGAMLSAADLAALRNDPSVAAVPGAKTSGTARHGDGSPASSLAASGIPSTALQAYQQAAQREAIESPDCGLPWPLLGGIGRVESNHGRFAGAVLHSDGLSTPPVVGIPLDGNGTALIRDTDNGRMDGDTVYDRAVGPMQFIPSTWGTWGVDANGDGVKDPYNIFDAAAAAADYLCAAGRNLATTKGQVQAILSYNESYDYVRLVMGVEQVYASDVNITVPVLPTPAEPPTSKPTLPPVDPGDPSGLNDPASPTPAPSPSHSAFGGNPAPSSPSTPYTPPVTQPVPSTSPTKTVTSSPLPPSSSAPPSGGQPETDGPSIVTSTPDPGTPSAPATGP